jgi:hypothetical protein
MSREGFKALKIAVVDQFVALVSQFCCLAGRLRGCEKIGCTPQSWRRPSPALLPAPREGLALRARVYRSYARALLSRPVEVYQP